MEKQLERTTRFPSLCPHCGKHSTSPPASVAALGIFARGKGAEVYHTVFSAAEQLGITRQAAGRLLHQAAEEGLLQAVATGSNTYHKTDLGTQVWSRWIRAGYTPARRERQ